MRTVNRQLFVLGVMALLVTRGVHAQHLFWVQAEYAAPKIRMMAPDGKDLTTLALPPGSIPHGLAFNGKPSVLYCASGAYQDAHLLSVLTTLSRVDTVQNGGGESSFEGAAVDTVDGKVYWTTSRIARGCSIRRANLDGTAEDSLIGYPANGPENLRGIALDLLHRMMFWTDFGTGVIRRATLDGANPQDIVTGLHGPLGIAVDVAAGKIYWCEASAHAIKSANLDGASVTTVVSGLISPQYLAIDPGDSLMFWTELAGSGHGKIKSARLDGSSPVTLLGNQSADSVSYPSGIAFVGSGATTGIPSIAGPLEFSLEQNFPNPFNPTTTIQYTVPGLGRQASGASEVRIVIYDLLGREVAVLVNARQAPGVHKVQFDGSNLSSGMYIYRISAANEVAAKTMLLLK